MIDLALPKIYSGKVRDLYRIDENKILMLASDRLSAFDVILADPIPQKGEILTQMSNAWFEFFKDEIPNHFTGDTVFDVLPQEQAAKLAKRAVVVKELTPVKIEAVVRGYIAGGGWKEYQRMGSICGIMLPKNLQLAQQLPEVLFTPSTKAEVGKHDENINFSQTCDILGTELANEVKQASLKLYTKAAAYAKTKGIIICDTKFEFGLDENGVLTLMDEVLTPDSSRYWAQKDYQTGVEPPAYDKQFIRNWLEQNGWNKKPPLPKIPAEIIHKTQQIYQQIYQILFN